MSFWFSRRKATFAEVSLIYSKLFEKYPKKTFDSALCKKKTLYVYMYDCNTPFPI